MHSPLNDLRSGVTIAPGCDISLCHLEHVVVGPNCRLHGCHIQGTPEAPISIAADVTLVQTQLRSFPSSAHFSFGGQSVAAGPVCIGQGTTFHGAYIENSTIGEQVTGNRCHITNSVVGNHCQLRAHASLVLTSAAAHCHLGSEVSKTLLLGEGFTSEHAASYLSLLAPTAYPILQPDGTEAICRDLPNLTNIGAGTVFANYSGKPLPAESLAAASGSLKGTSIAFGAFTAVNSVIVNRYGDVPDDDMFRWLRRRDLTILGFGSFVETKITGRIPAFAYAGGTRPDDIKLGWVLERQPGILLNILKKMQKRLGADCHRMAGLVEGTIRLELQLMQEQLAAPRPFYTKATINAAIALYERQLDGRWAIDESGQLTEGWHFHQSSQRWAPAL